MDRMDAVFWFLTQLGPIVGLVLGVFFVSHILLQKRTPAGTIAWLLVIVLVPYVGVPLYLLLGGRKMRRTAERKTPLALDPKASLDDEAAAIDRLLRTYGMPPAEPGNRVTLCGEGEQIYRCLADLIDNAEESIYISTFIFQTDAVGRAIRRRLVHKATQGLDVRVLMDGVGSLHTVWRFFRPLLRAGGRIAYFIPVLHRPFRGRTNLRNHRKIVIVDGRTVLAGGTNIGAEYIGPEPDPDRWKDLAFVLEGPAVRHYLKVFCADWTFAAGPDDSMRQASLPAPIPGSQIVQVLPSGPDVPNDALYDALLSAVYAAQERIFVVTPYFIPDESLAQALMLAARRGVAVHVLVPERSNHRLADLVRGNYLRELQQTGARVHLYTRSMLHAKVIQIDHEFVVLGSANMDIRSLFLNYEIAMFCYSPDVIMDTDRWIDALLADCRTGVRPVGFVRTLFEATVRLFAPLL